MTSSSYDEDVADVEIRRVGRVMRMLRGCYEETVPVEFGLRTQAPFAILCRTTLSEDVGCGQKRRYSVKWRCRGVVSRLVCVCVCVCE